MAPSPSPEQMQSQLSYELAVYREQLSMLKRETERVSLTALDLNNALRSIESLVNGRALVPIGGGALIKANLSETNVLVPIGGGYLVEMKKDVASVEVRKRIDATNNAIQKLTEEFNKLNDKLRSVSSQLGQMEAQSKLNQQVETNSRDDYL
ncbi:prefoldin subunit alpha [Candidatus Micrarchaeota archaeon]|nr:prefoldin subunit alpha [Candidatus Micrarchaeota archaeon]